MTVQRNRDGVNILIITVLWALAILMVNPLGAFPVTDDWAYAQSVRTLLATGHLHLSNWNATTLFTQIYWGAAFGAIFSPSNVVLRCSTLVAAWLGAIALYRLLRLARATPEMALLATLVAVFSPLSFLFSFSFMTDVPYTALQTAAMWLIAGGSLAGTYRQRAIGWVLAVAALLIRQVGLAIPVGAAGEMLVRRRWTLRTIAVAILPVLLFVVGQILFQRWLRASGIAPALYGRQIPTIASLLAKPGAELRNLLVTVSQCALNLGFFTLPLSIVAMGVLLDRRRALVLHAAAMVIAAVAVLTGLRYPTWINSLGRSGYGQDLVGTPSPEWIAIPLTVLAIIGAALLFVAVGAALFAWYRRERTEHFDITIFAMVTGLCLIAPLPFVPLRLDRYLIPILPCILILMVEVFRHKTPPRNTMIAGFASLALYATASIMATHDYMAAKRAQWAAYTDLTQHHVAPDHIDAGWVLNGPVSYGKHGNPEGIYGWYAVADYMLDPAPTRGYVTIARYPVNAWLPWNWNGRAILVKRRRNLVAERAAEPHI